MVDWTLSLSYLIRLMGNLIFAFKLSEHSTAYIKSFSFQVLKLRTRSLLWCHACVQISKKEWPSSSSSSLKLFNRYTGCLFTELSSGSILKILCALGLLNSSFQKPNCLDSTYYIFPPVIICFCKINEYQSYLNAFFVTFPISL